MRKGYFLTEREASNLYVILQFTIPQLKGGKTKSDAIKMFEKIKKAMLISSIRMLPSSSFDSDLGGLK